MNDKGICLFDYFAGRESLILKPATIGVMGTLIAIGAPVTYSWSALSTTASAGDSQLSVEGRLDWHIQDEIVVTPTDIDPHQVCLLILILCSGR